MADEEPDEGKGEEEDADDSYPGTQFPLGPQLCVDAECLAQGFQQAVFVE